MKKILFTGGTSLLGDGFIRKIPSGFKVILTEHQHKNFFKSRPDLQAVTLNVDNKNDTFSVVKDIEPDIIVHAASISNVDYCENNQGEAWRINVAGTKNVIQAAKKYNARILFISSNAVFDGKNPPSGGYSEEDLPNPINFYGKTKYEGEKLIQSSGIRYTIVRLITMYGWQPQYARLNPVTWALIKLKKRQKLKVVDDIYLNPLYNIDAGSILWRIITLAKTGIYHVAGNETISRFQWMYKVAHIFKYDLSLVIPVKSTYFERKIAPRPQKTVYSIKKIKKELNIIPRGIEQGLKAMRDEKS